jgi:hypothetical protein
MEADRPRARWRRVGVALAFLAFGPPLGTFPVALPILLLWSHSLAPLDALRVASMMTLASYVPGALPALLTGAIAAHGWPQRDWHAHLRIGMAGLLLSLICFAVALGVMGGLSESISTVVSLLLLCSLPGFVGATVVSRLLQWAVGLRQRRGANVSASAQA